MAKFLAILELLGLLLGAAIVFRILLGMAFAVLNNIAGALFFIYLLLRWLTGLSFRSFRRRAGRRRAAASISTPPWQDFA